MYVVKKRIKGRKYFYLCTSQRHRKKVCRKTICYLGPGESEECATVNRAIEYWAKTNNKRKAEELKKLIIMDQICSRIKVPLMPVGKACKFLADACFEGIRHYVFYESIFSNLRLLLEHDVELPKIKALLDAKLKFMQEKIEHERDMAFLEASRQIGKARRLFEGYKFSNPPPINAENEICAAITRTVKTFPILKKYLLAITSL